MAMVISSEEGNYFSAGGLRRTHSGKFASPHQSYSNVSVKSRSSSNFSTIIAPSTSSPLSSAPSSPRTIQTDSSAPSFTSTPASSLSLDTNCDEVEEEEDQILFPTYDDVRYYGQVEDLEPPASPRGTGDSYTVSPTSNSSSTNASRPGSPELAEHAEDDTAVRTQPSRHVDYLSHSWKEEDIWSSWKHIVSKRGAYSNSARLENASWRTWTKSKNKLKTVSPETLNWLKDCDVTWLYGPLQTGSEKGLRLPNSPSSSNSRMSKSNSFLHKKPILKKRSVSEIMLQRSLSASSLVKQAAAAVQAQSDQRPSVNRVNSDYVSFSFSSRRTSRENTSVHPSISSSGLTSPCAERKHIHFNEQVEQCIALDMKGDEEEEAEPTPVHNAYDSDSDDGGIMMKSTKSTKKLPAMRPKLPARSSYTSDSKTIAMLPSTTLKYRQDTPEPAETAMKHSNAFWNTGKLSPSPSQETLRPSNPSQRILLGDDDDDDADMDWQPPNTFLTRRDSVSVAQERLQNLHTSDSSSSLTGEPCGMRRTPSGMFMPYEEDEDDVVSEGLFGKVVDTVNTAKDIAHVIWNVGWRR
ncbi:MAG: hypothetical protein M1818_000690 [Claussenomyces sp. TS43310]|nr:MAG: hypothetical protein M1818_000690 [Claussenomyces sp. TS43310]